jgi:hypothetical protein
MPTERSEGRLSRSQPHGRWGKPGRGPTLRPSAVLVRQVANWVNLGTPLGLVIAFAGGARVSRGPHGLLLATGYRLPIPPIRGRAMTIGDVVLLGIDEDTLDRRPRLLAHEARHSAQYARWLGPIGFLPAYALASFWSWLRTKDPALRNHFETHAGLHDGGYLT